jgi:DNA repair protein RadC
LTKTNRIYLGGLINELKKFNRLFNSISDQAEKSVNLKRTFEIMQRIISEEEKEKGTIKEWKEFIGSMRYQES